MECGEFGFDGKRIEQTKYALQRLQPLIKRSIKVLQIDIDRLEKHRKNISRLHCSSEFPALSKEQKNAQTTVEQINTQIIQLENIRSQVQDSDLHVFDKEVKSIYQEAHSLTETFLTEEVKLCNDVTEDRPAYIQSCPGSPLNSPILEESQICLQEELNTSSTAQHSWEDLQQSLEDLNKLIYDYSTLVQDQQAPVDNIETNIVEAALEVHEGSKSLIKASKIKAAVFPVAGMIIGGAIGGPVGMVAGLKLGAAACLGGSVIGFTGGRFFKKRHDNYSIGLESNLSKNNSKSVPELYISDIEIVSQPVNDDNDSSSVT